MISDIVLLLVCIGLSAFFSGTETAFVTARHITFLIWIKQEKRGAKEVYEFLQKPEQYLTTTLVGNNIAVVAASALITVSLKDSFSGWQISLIGTSVLLVFGEIIPKFIGREMANTISLYSYKPHRAFHHLFSPVIWVVKHITGAVLALFRIRSETMYSYFSRDDLNILVHEGEETGLINRDERRKISRMVIRGRKTVHEVMIPRTEITFISRDASLHDAARQFLQSGFSRLPVIAGDIDNISGMVYVSDLLCRKPATLEDIIREILYVPESMNMMNLLHSMRKNGVTMAVAVDEYGGTAGLVTVEDLVEEFFGAIEDEYDDRRDRVTRVGETRLDVNARIEIDELNDRFHLGLQTGDYQTLAGLITTRLGRIPRRGEKIMLANCTLIVLAAQHHRITRVRILLRKPNAPASG
ncbi:HlyC/CorC family transporter [bacterium]|nr:HlyC/CorC family transporter [bacterium]